jgi:5'-nucleotidase
MNILVSNDDGVHAPGIKSLYKRLQEVSRPLIVAPLQERSTTGHSLSLDQPLRVQKIEDQVYGCSGFPADCILMGLGHICEGKRPELVVSGINSGPNLGQDIYYSGTVAAAREATFHGVKSIAVSLVIEHSTDEAHFDTAAIFIRKLIKDDIAMMIPQLCVVNVNVPNLPLSEIKGVKLTTIGFKDYSEDICARVDSRERDYFWITGNYRGFRQQAGTDCEACDKGYISVTPHFLTECSDKSIGELTDYIKGITIIDD